MQNIQATVLTVLKFLGILVSLVSGMVATAFETREDDGAGSKRLSRFGKIVFTCVVLGSVISAGTQLVEDRLSAAEKAQDIKRISYIIDGTQRIEHRMQPITWNVWVRYRVDASSILSSYLNRIRAEHKGVAGFPLVDKYLPDQNNPREIGAWHVLMQPSIYIGIVKPETFSGVAKDMAIPIIPGGVPVLLTTFEHADKEGKWKPGPNSAAPPFYSTIDIDDRGGELWAIQRFVIRDSPQATAVSGVISPLDIGGYVVVAEWDERLNAEVDNVNILFPTANRGVDVNMAPSAPVMGFSRSVGHLATSEIRKVLNISDVP